MSNDDLDLALNDPDEWGDAEPSKPAKSGKRQRSVVVSVRMTPEEFAQIERQAEERGAAVSALLRESALATAACKPRRADLQVANKTFHAQLTVTGVGAAGTSSQGNAAGIAPSGFAVVRTSL